MIDFSLDSQIPDTSFTVSPGNAKKKISFFLCFDPKPWFIQYSGVIRVGALLTDF